MLTWFPKIKSLLEQNVPYSQQAKVEVHQRFIQLVEQPLRFSVIARLLEIICTDPTTPEAAAASC
jgi:hypothetical protein